MAKPIKIEKAKADKEPYLIWNAFLDLIADSEPEDLNDVQSIAQFAFWYDSEVQNGGHFQYFENKFIEYEDRLSILILATMKALKIIGAKKQEKILSSASKQYFKQRRQHPSTVEEYVEIEAEDEFEKFDDKYYDCSPDVNECLEKFIQKHMSEFVELV